MLGAVAKPQHLIVAALTAVALAILLVGAGAGTPRAQVPGVLGKDKHRAVERIEKRDLRAEVIVKDRKTRKLPPRFIGEVVHQSFRRGITLPRGSVVRVTVYPKRRKLLRRPRARGGIDAHRAAGTSGNSG